MGSNPGQVELEMRSTSGQVVLEPKKAISFIVQQSINLRAFAFPSQISKIMWQYISLKVLDGSVVNAKVPGS